jgi:filamentous hemagglutinin
MQQEGYAPNYPIEVANVDGYLIIIDGHHRARAARAAGILTVPVKFVEVSVQHGNILLDQAFEAAQAIGRTALRRFVP